MSKINYKHGNTSRIICADKEAEAHLNGPYKEYLYKKVWDFFTVGDKDNPTALLKAIETEQKMIDEIEDIDVREAITIFTESIIYEAKYDAETMKMQKEKGLLN